MFVFFAEEEMCMLAKERYKMSVILPSIVFNLFPTNNDNSTNLDPCSSLPKKCYSFMKNAYKLIHCINRLSLSQHILGNMSI